ncbi:MAG: hypothetical protein ABI831_25730, partial [Betaproteobacteria bacterium]
CRRHALSGVSNRSWMPRSPDIHAPDDAKSRSERAPEYQAETYRKPDMNIPVKNKATWQTGPTTSDLNAAIITTGTRHHAPMRQAKGGWAAALAGLCLSVGSLGAHGQAVVMAGMYQNFDVLNNTGAPTYGFEMEVHGVSSSQLTRIFPSNFNQSVIRYGFGTATDFPGGVYVRWIAPYDAATGTFTTATPVPQSLTTVPGDSCWTLGMPQTYQTAGCEHFGISTNGANPSQILYRWLVADPANPGSVKPTGVDISLPAPSWIAVQPANPGLPAVVVAQVEAPPAPVPVQFGDAQWVRVYKTEQPGQVDLDDLVGDNHAVVPENVAQQEVSWSLLQRDPPALGGQRQRGKLANQGNLGNGNHAVVRRYEFYQYAGDYDPITHEALCADLLCKMPGPGEVGDAIGAQNVAANLNVNSLTVNLVGNGGVQSSDKVFACPSKCYGLYAPGTTVTLTAKANSGSVFSQWSGACAGNASTCTVAVNAESTVMATFATAPAGGGGGGGGAGGGGGGAAGGGGAGGGASAFALSVSFGNVGNVSSAPSGINCNAACAANFAAGTAVTLTATPPAGLAFSSWGGACAGAQPTCTVTMSKSLSVKASFTK